MDRAIAIEAHDLTVSYDRKPALWNVDFELPEGRIVGIIGPNGAGKSTLLKTIMGLMRPASGYVRVFDTTLDQVRNRVSYVPQRGSVDWDFPASVLEVVRMGLYGRPGGRAAQREASMAALEKVGLQSYSGRHISQLSGGQQQRVFIARAMAQQADLYLMDEPFAGVDAATQESILALMAEMRNAGKSIVVVHHDLQTARNYFDWIVLLNTHLVAAGPVSETFTADNIRQTYGGSLILLDEIRDHIEREDLPLRKG